MAFCHSNTQNNFRYRNISKLKDFKNKDFSFSDPQAEFESVALKAGTVGLIVIQTRT